MLPVLGLSGNTTENNIAASLPEDSLNSFVDLQSKKDSRSRAKNDFIRGYYISLLRFRVKKMTQISTHI